MCIEQLPNPVKEQQNYVVEYISDKDICKAILRANGGYGSGTENPEEAEDKMSLCLIHCEAPAAISGLQRYVQDIDTPYR